MRKEIKVVIGAVFGDEGKGLMTDYFCNSFPKDKKVLNIRFNGSSQAGHTVVTSGGKSHVFSHFGAGSFNENVITYLSSYFIVSPIGFMREYERLVKQDVKPQVYLCKDSSLILPFDSLINIFLETARNKDRHGSCGIGVFEAVIRSKQDNLNITVADLQYGKNKLFNRLVEMRDTYFTERLKEIGENNIDEKEISLFYNDGLIWNFIEDAKEMLRIAKIVDDSILNTFEYQVYEGAQGLLLDWGNREYMPNLTASYTGLKNIVPLLSSIEEIFKDDVEICYVARSYFTRHGAGRFETEVPSKEELGYNIIEKTNMTNEWQGHFRFGYFDKPLFIKNIKKDLEYLDNLNNTSKVSLAITHLDQTKNKILLGKNNEESIEEFVNNLQNLKLDNLYISESELRENIKRTNFALTSV